MRILIANDDGCDAPGLLLLAQAAQGLARDVWTVAPERKWTAASHQLSFDRDLDLTEIGERRYACSGAPADCVVAAMTILFAGGAKPDLVLAGINDKRNVGEDIAYSGTLAIGREAAFCNVPAISLSRDAWPDQPDVAEVAHLLQALWQTRDMWVAPGTWLALNLPRTLPAPLRQASPAHDKIASAADVVTLQADRMVYRLRRGRPGSAQPGDENDALAGGAIVVTRHSVHAARPLADSTLAHWALLLQ